MRLVETSFLERNFQRGFRLGGAALAGALLLTVSGSALALPEFPQVIVDTLSEQGLTCTPTCSLCHTSPSPDSGNAAQPIANNLVLFRAPPGPITLPLEPENLPVYLEALQKEPCANRDDSACADPMNCLPCDGDGDGTPDIAELLADENPNGSGKLACPQYGCGAHIAPERRSRPLDGTAVLAALSAAVVLVRRWRRG
jgi:hypothetical protein